MQRRLGLRIDLVAVGQLLPIFGLSAFPRFPGYGRRADACLGYPQVAVAQNGVLRGTAFAFGIHGMSSGCAVVSAVMG
jgi:hypothetical protein